MCIPPEFLTCLRENLHKKQFLCASLSWTLSYNGLPELQIFRKSLKTLSAEEVFQVTVTLGGLRRWTSSLRNLVHLPLGTPFSVLSLLNGLTQGDITKLHNYETIVHPTISEMVLMEAWTSTKCRVSHLYFILSGMVLMGAWPSTKCMR